MILQNAIEEFSNILYRFLSYFEYTRKTTSQIYKRIVNHSMNVLRVYRS